MFISEHQRKTNLCRNPNYIFFVIPKVCWTACVFHFLNLESLKRIYASLFTFRDFRNRRTMILKVEQTLKPRKGTLQRVNAFFTNLLSKMWKDDVVKTIYCQRNSIFLRQKNYCIHYFTSQNRGLSGLKNIWPVIMTGDLLSVIFSPGLYSLILLVTVWLHILIFWIFRHNIPARILLDALFRLFRISKASFYALTSSFTTL